MISTPDRFTDKLSNGFILETGMDDNNMHWGQIIEVVDGIKTIQAGTIGTTTHEILKWANDYCQSMGL